MVLRIAVYRVNFFEHLLLKSSESHSEMPPIRLKDKYSEHFSLGTDDDGTTTVDYHYCASKLSYYGSTSSMTYHFESRVGVTLWQRLISNYYLVC